MGLRIFNTLTGKKEDFLPLEEGKVKMYVCGVTVYDRCHIGHARAGVAFDFVFRSLKHLGYDVTYIRNFTDVDDKIINRANERGISCDELVAENIKAFYEDMDALYLQRPNGEPRATLYIPQMIKLIEELVARKLAYESEGDVFFSVRDFPHYGALSKRNLDELEEGARVEVNEAKRDPLDFALWKKAKPGEPKWPSPWGEGRPGWHIECSAMGRDLLGKTFDIHGGGKDLVFPHHENEIAQSHGASGCAPVNYWMHNGFVNINKEKMSKSLGNFFTIKDVISKFDPEAVRYYLLSTHYRSPIDFADPYLAEAERTISRFYSASARAESLLEDLDAEAGIPDDYSEKLKSAIEDDFNSAAVIALLNEADGNVNRLCDGFKKKNREGAAKLASELAFFKKICGLLGVLNRDPKEFLESLKEKHLASIGMGADEVLDLIEKRNEARVEKNFHKSDNIRDELASKGIVLNDSPTGTTWTVKV
ncbi:MAG: cysteine--tRNA ligase [Nitrospinota bacterium]|nr:cysteine--tRNA ligase [Nitrospinota bacterium]